MNKPTTTTPATRSGALGNHLLKNKLKHRTVNDTRSPQRKMMDEVFGAIRKYELGRNVLSSAEKIGTGISERFSKKIQPYLARFFDSKKPRDLEEEHKAKGKNNAVLLKTDHQPDVKDLVLTTQINDIKKSLSKQITPPSNQISLTSKQSNRRSR